MGWMLRGVAATDDRAFVGRDGDPPRARRRHLALGHGRHRRRLGGLGPAAPRRRAAAAQGRAPAALRVDAVRRRPADPGRLRHQLHVLPGAAAPHRPRPGPPRPGRAGHRGAPRARDRTTTTRRCGPAPRSCPCSTPRGRRRSDDAADRPATSTTRSWSAAATTGWSTPATSPRRGCARWSSSSATSSAAPRSPRSCVPGFSFTTFSYALSLLRPEIIHELDLVEHGFLPLMMPSLVPPDRGRRLPAARRRPRAERPGDPPALAATTPTPTTATTTTSTGSCQAVQPLFDNPPPNVFGKDPEDQADVAWLLDHLGGVERR